MSLAIHPLHLGELETDFSMLIWQTKCGTRTYVPSTCWLITGAEKPILVDTSFRSVEDLMTFSRSIARRSPEQTLEAQLARHRLQSADIGYVVHTHLRNDHCGLDDLLPNARILLQRKELQQDPNYRARVDAQAREQGIAAARARKEQQLLRQSTGEP